MPSNGAESQVEAACGSGKLLRHGQWQIQGHRRRKQWKMMRLVLLQNGQNSTRRPEEKCAFQSHDQQLQLKLSIHTLPPAKSCVKARQTASDMTKAQNPQNPLAAQHSN